jgi:hypothetical protein
MGVLPSRFVKLKFVKSFYGHEDTSLRGKLEAELPGIAARCVRAYQRLCGAERFVQPKSGFALDREVVRVSDPWVAMLDECFVVEPEAGGDQEQSPRALRAVVRGKWTAGHADEHQPREVHRAPEGPSPRRRRAPPARPTPPVCRPALRRAEEGELGPEEPVR